MTQWFLYRHEFLPGAIITSGLRNFFGWKPTLGSVALIPLRAAWNMGQGLLFSRLTEELVRDLPEDSVLRKYGPTAAFFVPDVAHIVAPQTTFQVLQNRPMRLAARAFAAGFIADMAFTGIHHLVHGSESSLEQWMDYRAAQLRRERGDIGPLNPRNLLRFLAPSLSAYVDSHEYFLGGENEYRREARQLTRERNTEFARSLREDLPKFAEVLGRPLEEILQKKIELSPLEQLMREQLNFSEQRQGRLRDFEKNIPYLQEQFRGHHLSAEQIRPMLARIYLSQWQEVYDPTLQLL
jgi:hypothetical protein